MRRLFCFKLTIFPLVKLIGNGHFMKIILKAITVLLLLAFPIYAQSDIAGTWGGEIKMLTMQLEFQLKIVKSKNSFAGFMSIPSQKLNEYQLQVFTFKKNKIHFELPSQAGTAKFDGDLKADSIKGKILQAGIEGSFYLTKNKKTGATVQTEIKKSELLSYSEEEVAFKSGRILLAGTLTYPKSGNKFPTVILLTGNGPQNRDEDILGFKIFERIADYLSSHGFAVLRYDDRGVGGSTGNTMRSTTADFADDAKAAIDFLKKQSNIDSKKISLLGHSEGASIAALAADNNKDVACLIFMSAPGLPGGEILLEQQRLILKAGKVSDEIIGQNLELQKKINDVLLKNKDFETLRKDIETFAQKDFETLSPEIKNSIKDKNAYINSTVQSQIAMFDNPWFHYYIQYDPSLILSKINQPVLLTFGGLDLQVPVNQNKPVIEEALKRGGNNKIKSVVFPKANHLYQEAVTGSPAEYQSIKKEFVDGFLKDISDWLEQNLK